MTKKFVAGLLAGAILFVGIALVIFNYGLKTYNWTSPTVQAIVKVLPFSAMSVNRYDYSYYDYLTDWNTIKMFMEQNGQVEGMDELSLKQEILRSALESLLVESVAARYDVSVGQADYDATWQLVLGVEEPTEDDWKAFDQNLMDSYGWTRETYEKRVVHLYALTEKLSEKVGQDANLQANKDAKQAIEEVLAKLQAGEDFATLAQTYSDDGSAAEGGSLGWFDPDQMVPEFVEQLKTMEKGQVSGVFTTRYGYHIVKLEDIRQTEEGKTEYNASHIIKLFASLDDLIGEEKTNANIEVYINGVEPETLL
jgi:hypothetical protein